MAEYHLEQYLDAARVLAVKVAAQAERIDQERRVPADLAGELADQGFFKLLVPRSLGGVEMAQPDFMRIIETFARADASTAWCLSQNNVVASNSAKIPEETAREIWGEARAIVANGPPAPTAQAIPVAGGYQLSGRWDFSSGSSNATWIAALTPVIETTEKKGPPRMIVLLMPKKEVRFLDHWDVKGLRGTGSFSFEVADKFVPSRHTYDQTDAFRETGPLFALPRTLLFGSGNATVALGVAQASVTTVVDLIANTSRSTTTLIQDRTSTHRTLGEADALWRSARAFLRESAKVVWQETVATRAPTAEHRLRFRLAITHAILTSARVVEMTYGMCGSSAIFSENPIQRLFQDMHVISQHIQARSTYYETAGQFLLGLNPEGGF